MMELQHCRSQIVRFGLARQSQLSISIQLVPFFPHTSQPLVFAHRGGRALGPENTLVAFDIGMASGADGMELDVHCRVTAGSWCVMTRPSIARPTRKERWPTRTAAELAALNATVRFGIDLEHAWTGARAGIPTLDDVMLRYPDARAIIEIKDCTEACAVAVVDAVRRAGALDRVCVGSFSLLALQAVARSNRSWSPAPPSRKGNGPSTVPGLA